MNSTSMPDFNNEYFVLLILLPFMLNDIALKEELMMSDGIHPNKDAQPLIAEIVFNSLKPHLK